MLDPIITATRIDHWEEEGICDFCGAPLLTGDKVFIVDDRKDVERSGWLGSACSRWCANKIVRSVFNGAF